MTTSHLPRRTVVGSVLAASLIGAGVIAFAAAPAPCTTPPTYTDPAGDAALLDPATAPLTGDDDLDIIGVTQSVDDGVFSTRIKVVKLLADGPSFSFIDRFTSTFTVAKKVVVITFERDFSSVPGATPKKASATVGGTAVTFPVTLIEDVKSSTIGASLAVADLEKVIAAPLAGEAFTAMSATSKDAYVSNVQPVTLQSTNDTATAPATATYLFGTSCSGGAAAPAPAASSTDAASASPAPSGTASPNPSGSASPKPSATAVPSDGPTFSNAGATRAQFRDKAAVAAKLVDSTGKPMAGKKVTFSLGESTASGITNSSGVARASLTAASRAGKRPLTFATTGARDAVEFTILVERTALGASASGGTVSARMTDDDGRPVSLQLVTFSGGGRTVTARTNADGLVRADGFRRGVTVSVRYPGASGAYTAASTSTRA